MKRIHILTAALLATSLAAPAAFAQTNTGSGSTGGNSNGATTGYSNSGYGYNNNGYGNGGNGYGSSGYNSGYSGNTGNYNGANGYNSGNGGANGYSNASYGNNGGNGNGSMGSNVGAGAVLTVAPSGVREVQQALNRLGYQAGPINGVWDRRTANAMLNFQQAHGLAPTGNLNLSSVAALGLWGNVIGNPIGNGNRPLVGTNGMPPNRGGRNGTSVGGEPLPSQRIVNGSPDTGNGNGGNGGGR